MSDYYIHTSELSVGYNGTPIIEKINIGLNRGQIMTLIGPNGAGKSTLLKSMSRQLAPVAGTVWLDQASLAKLTEKDVSRRLSLVLTEHLRPELMTCLDVVSTGRYPYTGRLGILSSHDREIVQDALRRVHGEDLAERDFNCISDGQRQRILLARALCQEPEVIVLDEPTSFLDIRHKLELLTILKEMVRENNLAVLMSLHELDLAERISDIVVCVHGHRIEKCGTPEEIFASDYIHRLYELEKGSFNPDFGCVELERVTGKPQAFVIGGAGSGIPLYRRLQREGIPFAAGVLHENDLDYAVARALAAEVVTEEAFSPISQEKLEQAMALLNQCEKVYCTLSRFGMGNQGNQLLLTAAEKAGKLCIAE